MKKIMNYEDFCNEEVNWKKSILTPLLGASLLTSPIHSQITTKKLEPTSEIKPIQYDSTTNKPIGLEGAKSLIGQELYLRKDKRFYHPLNDFRNQYFFNDYKDRNSQVDINYLTKLENKYFIVLDLIKHEYTIAKQTDPQFSHLSGKIVRNYYLKLQKKDDKKIIYYEIGDLENNIYLNYNFPFIRVEFYKKLKSLMIGTEFEITKYWDETDKKLEIWSEESLRLKVLNKNFTPHFQSFKQNAFGDPWKSDITNPGKISILGIWKCVDLIIDENNWELSLLLENELGNQISFPYHLCFGYYPREIILPKTN